MNDNGEKIVKLVTSPSGQEVINSQMVEYLEECLRKAKEGLLIDIIIIAGRSDGNWMDRCSGTTHLAQQIGRLEIVKDALITQYRKEYES